MNFFKMAVVSMLVLGVMFSTGCANMNQKQQAPQKTDAEMNQRQQAPPKTNAEMEAEEMQRFWTAFAIAFIVLKKN